ncbi:hypothetical protein IMG5_131360 [Ichthyophthirius multifiliis]|uniref:Uncharacterized protein n=1 Tax=Ichthyophthirius multifiliis TaxID=5932 RepID=G0QWE5_ICHMU|nr:hypothetical protein IMG5_131360 [Ichthyophthirius multifiliis]EGR30462.1 hypothetical protein IMG5_131360 [Ichthyophthirius multifiliis]|eukprot:XP_004032049.1 hypothetical protein IMG5_131360 [Ichthyophthirius multifiliis]
MWFKFFSKQSWNLRIWRKCNLKFNQDDQGMLRHKGIGRYTDFLFRMVRNEGPIRGSMFFIGFGLASSVGYVFNNYIDPYFFESGRIQAAIDLKQNDEQAVSKLFFNRFGAPSRPLRSLEDMIAFLSGSVTYDQLADFTSYSHAMDVNADQQAGLDSWMSQNDLNMLKYYQKSIGKKVEGI